MSNPTPPSAKLDILVPHETMKKMTEHAEHLQSLLLDANLLVVSLIRKAGGKVVIEKEDWLAITRDMMLKWEQFEDGSTHYSIERMQ